jgi:hypothetical protein
MRLRVKTKLLIRIHKEHTPGDNFLRYMSPHGKITVLTYPFLIPGAQHEDPDDHGGDVEEPVQHP